MSFFIKKIDPYYQTLYVVWGNQILFWSLFIFSFQLYWIFIALIMMYVFGCMSEISLHRYFAHKSYSTTLIKDKILLLFATLVGQGAVLSWVAVHRTHHAYEDTNKDPHSPKFIPSWKILLGLFPRNNYKLSLISDHIRSNNRRILNFENNYYWIIHTLLWILLYNINLTLLFSFVSGSALWYICTQSVNIFAHKNDGKKEFPNAVAINSKILDLFTGAGYHNNHHANPKNYNYKNNKKIDIHAFVIKHFFAI